MIASSAFIFNQGFFPFSLYRGRRLASAINRHEWTAEKKEKEDLSAGD